MRSKFDEFLASRAMPANERAALTPEQSENLFQQFQKWQALQGRNATKH
jgi:hypothetical protein